MVVFGMNDIPPDGFLIIEEDEASILESQDAFYGGIERKNIVEISTGLDTLAHRSLLYLGKALKAEFSFKNHNQIAAMAREIIVDVCRGVGEELSQKFTPWVCLCPPAHSRALTVLSDRTFITQTWVSGLI